MSIMGRMAKIDSAMQRGLDNSFAFVFGGRVVPAEIEEILKREMEDNVVHTYEGSVEAPNAFHVLVSPKDFQNLSEAHPDMPAEFADQLTRFARNKGWATAGQVVVSVKVHDALKTGQLQASSAMTSDPGTLSAYDGIEPPARTEAAPEPEPAPKPEVVDNPHAATALHQAIVEEPPYEEPVSDPLTVSLLLQDGSSRTYLVQEGSNIIGRANDADFRLPDTGVSRQHAEVVFNGQDAILVDLKSTNGTTVNDTPIENWLLADGDVITLGHSHIEVRIN